jgi:hypothetical protein
MFGRNRPPATVRAWLEGDERVLAWGVVGGAAGDGFVVATNEGLWWPDPQPRRIPWHLIVRASWSERGLTVVEADVVDDLLLVERPAKTVDLTREGKIPPIVRKRVEGSIAATHDVRLDDGPARLVARRVTGQDGQVWLARLGPRTPDTERARAQVHALLERFRLEDEARREALLR